MRYLVRTPWILKKLIYPSYTWEIPTREKVLYLSFDDGPHPRETPFVLDQLKARGARASFFCIGKNVRQYPELYQRILAEGHSVGNHTYNHLNGWKSVNKQYFEDIQQAASLISGPFFRPPYGRIARSQAKYLNKTLNFRIIMWSVLSGDFDTRLSPEGCWENLRNSLQKGDIIVFHDSDKAAVRLRYALPKLLEIYGERGYRFEGITG